MSEKVEFGFTHEIKCNDPKGNVVEDLTLHNLIPDETVKMMLGKFFFPKQIYIENNQYGWFLHNYIFLSLMTKERKAAKTDTILNNWEEFGEITRNDVNYYGRKWFSGNPSLDKNTPNRVNLGNKTRITFIKRTQITGIFLLTNSDSGASPKVGYKPTYPTHLLLSETMFPRPVLMEANGTIDVTSYFTMASA